VPAQYRVALAALWKLVEPPRADRRCTRAQANASAGRPVRPGCAALQQNARRAIVPIVD
jgi:hypothetical protein